VEKRSTSSALATKQDVNEPAGKLNTVMETLDKSSSAVTELIMEMRELRKSQQFLSEQYEDMKRTLQSSTEEVKALCSENQDLKDHVQKLEDASCQTQEALNDLEQYGRRECLEFQGLAWSANENTDKLSTSVSKLTEVDLSVKDISVSHRLSGKSDSNPRPTIIARFCSRRIRDEIYSHRHRLKEYNKTHPQERIYINESLTRTNRQRFNKCLLYRKSNNFKYIWTRNGTTYLRRNEDSNTIPITKESDLVRYKIINH